MATSNDEPWLRVRHPTQIRTHKNDIHRSVLFRKRRKQIIMGYNSLNGIYVLCNDPDLVLYTGEIVCRIVKKQNKKQLRVTGDPDCNIKEDQELIHVRQRNPTEVILGRFRVNVSRRVKGRDKRLKTGILTVKATTVLARLSTLMSDRLITQSLGA